MARPLLPVVVLGCLLLAVVGAASSVAAARSDGDTVPGAHEDSYADDYNRGDDPLFPSIGDIIKGVHEKGNAITVRIIDTIKERGGAAGKVLGGFFEGGNKVYNDWVALWFPTTRETYGERACRVYCHEEWPEDDADEDQRVCRQACNARIKGQLKACGADTEAASEVKYRFWTGCSFGRAIGRGVFTLDEGLELCGKFCDSLFKDHKLSYLFKTTCTATCNKAISFSRKFGSCRNLVCRFATLESCFRPCNFAAGLWYDIHKVWDSKDGSNNVWLSDGAGAWADDDDDK